MNKTIGSRWGAINQTRHSSTRRAGGARRAVSLGLLVLATVMGVHLGLDGPAVSPVSPAAIAARYGAPRANPPAPPPVVARTKPQGHGHDLHDGRAHA